MAVHYSAFTQIKWRNDSVPFSQIEWNNMSTSYIDNPDKLIAIVTAIPYNGIDEVSSNTELDYFFTSSYYKYQSNLSNHFQKLDTYDSGNVYFLTPGIFKSNASDFEFRVLKDGDSVMRPWSEITQFADSNFQLNSFKKFCGFLGGYHTDWNHFLTVQLRRKSSQKTFAESSVYWKQIHPQITSIYTSDDLNAFLKRLKKSYATPDEVNKAKRWVETYASKGDSLHHHPKKFIFEAGESNIIFYLNASIYAKEALEYLLIRNRKTVVNWKSNDYDNDFIWLHNLKSGDYTLQIRFSKQRHNASSYAFEIKPFWYQTNVFKISLVVLCVLLLLLIIIFILNRQKLIHEKKLTERLQLEQRVVRAQLNPHFTFNALSSIQSLMNQNKISEADYYFTAFSSLLRNSLRNSEKEMLPLQIELQTLEQYIKLEQLRFPFHYEITVAENINTSTTDIPSLLLQPLVENAIRHGVSSLQEKGNILVDIMKEEKNLVINITDNGAGFNSQKESKGYGLALTKERIRLLNKKFKEQKIQMVINSIANGTTVNLSFIHYL